MKQLFKSGNATTLFFEDDTNIEDVSDWISINIHTGNNLFDLNEPHSAKVEVFGTSILISGDEDLVELTFEEITPIKL